MTTHPMGPGSFKFVKIRQENIHIQGYQPCLEPAVASSLPYSVAPAEATVLVLDPQTGGYKEVMEYLKVSSIPVVATVPAPSPLLPYYHDIRSNIMKGGGLDSTPVCCAFDELTAHY
ncbi:hypothetical protein B7463_g10859, partial [Scytalidium lignicola]